MGRNKIPEVIGLFILFRIYLPCQIEFEKKTKQNKTKQKNTFILRKLNHFQLNPLHGIFLVYFYRSLSCHN